MTSYLFLIASCKRQTSNLILPEMVVVGVLLQKTDIIKPSSIKRQDSFRSRVHPLPPIPLPSRHITHASLSSPTETNPPPPDPPVLLHLYPTHHNRQQQKYLPCEFHSVKWSIFGYGGGKDGCMWEGLKVFNGLKF